MNKYITKVELPYIPKGSELLYDELNEQYCVTTSNPTQKYQWYKKEIVEDTNSPFFTLNPDFKEEKQIIKAMAELGLKLDVVTMAIVSDFLKKYNMYFIDNLTLKDLARIFTSSISKNGIKDEMINLLADDICQGWSNALSEKTNVYNGVDSFFSKYITTIKSNESPV